MRARIRLAGWRARGAIVVAALIIGWADGASAQVRISEIGAVNTVTIADDDGDYSDWIEIHNEGAGPVALAGWGLSDDPGAVFRWRFPARTLGAGERLIVFASGKDRASDDAGAALHAGFRLDGGGEFLALTRPDGSMADGFVPGFPEQRADVSYGRSGGDGSLGYFPRPTPGAANGAARSGFAGAIAADRARGLYRSAIRVRLDCPDSPGARIVFTTDGSVPGAHNGRIFREPIEIARTTVLRARAFRDDLVPGPVATNSYLFPADVVLQEAMSPAVTDDPDYADLVEPALSALPALSLAVDEEAFFGAEGIYTDFNDRGDEAEVPLSVEFVAGDPRAAGFQIDAGIRIHGGQARQHAKKPMRLYFRSEYGAPRLEFPLFEGSPVTGFERLVLRGGGHDAWTSDWGDGRNDLTDTASYLRDEFIRRTELEMGLLSPRGRFVQLFINGRYWGLYNLHERVDATFFADHLGGDPDEWDVVKPEPEAADGTRVAWENLLAASGSGTAGDYAAIRPYLEPRLFIDAMISRIWSGDHDWLAPVYLGRFPVTLENNRNWFAGRRSRGGAPSPFVFFSWDAEISMGNDRFLFSGNRELDFDLTRIAQPDSPAVPYDAFRGNPEFRLHFADRLRRHLFDGGALSEERTLARWVALEDEIRDALVGESARWGNIHGGRPLRRDAEWASETRWMRETFLALRTELVADQFRAVGLLPDTEPASVEPPGGPVEPGTLVSIGNPNGEGTVYYTTDGSDPRLPAEVPMRVLLDEFAPTEALVPTEENGGATLGDAWKQPGPPPNADAWVRGLGGVGFEDTPADFRELIGLPVPGMQGTQTSVFVRVPFDVGDQAAIDAIASLVLQMKFDDGFVAHLNGVEVARANAPAALSWDAAAVASNPDSAARLFEAFDITAHRSLLRPGANLLAIHGLNAGLNSSDLLVSPRLVGFGEPSAERIAESAQVYDGPFALGSTSTVNARIRIPDAGWSPLAEARFTVGGASPEPGDLVFSEIHYHPADPSTPAESAGPWDDEDFEFIEVANTGARPLALGGVRIDGGVDFVFGPGTVLAPGAAVAVAANADAFAARYGPAAASALAGTFASDRRLSNAGEGIRLVAVSGSTLESAEYGDDFPWPPGPDGAGASLERRIDGGGPRGPAADASSWRASWADHGSPGRVPDLEDGDGDGLPDPWEIAFLGGLQAGPGNDADADGLDHASEFAAGTDPADPDSDADGLADGIEVGTARTDPLVADSDGDGLDDGFEVGEAGTDPLAADSDGDGLDDREELLLAGADPLVADADGDGFSDGFEAARGAMPGDPASIPVPTQGDLVVLSPFDEGMVAPTRVVNVTGAGDGTTVEAVTEPGIVGEALPLGGVRGPVDFRALGDPGSGPFSVALWVRIDDANGYRRIAGKGAADAGAPGWSITSDDGRIHFRAAGSDGTRFAARTRSELPAGGWHHLAMAIDPESGRWDAWLDGSASGVEIEAGRPPARGDVVASRDSFRLGTSGDEEFKGLVDDLAVWRFPLVESHARRLHEAGRAGIPAGEAFLLRDDSDADGLTDSWELANFGNLDASADGDPDGDSLANAIEEIMGSDPRVGDTDRDGASDADEAARGSDPLDPGSVPETADPLEGLVVHYSMDASDLTGTGFGALVFDLTSPAENARVEGRLETAAGFVGGAVRVSEGMVAWSADLADAPGGGASIVTGAWLRPVRANPGVVETALSGRWAGLAWNVGLRGARWTAFGEAVGGGEWSIDSGGENAYPGRWSHLALALDPASGVLRLFVDGREAGSATLGADPGAGGSVASFRIAEPAPGIAAARFGGLIDEATVWAIPSDAGGGDSARRLAARVFRAGLVDVPVNELPGPVEPPAIVVDADAIELLVNPGGSGNAVLRIGNAGGSVLNYLVALDLGDREPLADVLADLDAAGTSVTSLIPDRYNFSEGVNGSEIDDGGLDMYDGGNILSTNRGGPIAYSNGRISTHPGLGDASYFTRKLSGLFVFAADLIDVDRFEIEGNLGADGIGSVSGTRLAATRGNRAFSGFVKRVYDGVDPINGGIDPSVNHVVIVEDVPAASHTFSIDTDNDAHRVDGIGGAGRLYYLLFASRDGRFVTDDETTAIFEAFLDAVGIRPDWVQAPAEADVGQVGPGGEAIEVPLAFDAAAFESGGATATLRIVSNDPNAPLREIPVVLRINSAPVPLAVAPVARLEDGPPVEVDLRTSFVDAEHAPEALAYEVVDPGDPGLLADVGIRGTDGVLTATLAPDASGTSVIRVRATDPLGLSAELEIAIAVEPVNDPPVVVAEAAVTVDEDAPEAIVPLGGVFADVDHSVADLVFMSGGGFGPPAESTGLSADGRSLLVRFLPDAFGSTGVVVTATDPGGLSASYFVPIVVRPVNDAPVAVIRPVVAGFEDRGPIAVEGRSWFRDVDDPAESLDVGIVRVDDPAGVLAAARIDPASGRLGLDLAADASGAAAILLRATDPGGLGADSTVLVEIAPVEDAPRAEPLPAIVADAAASDAELEAGGYFNDPDAGDRLLYSIEANTNPAIFRDVFIDLDSGRLVAVFRPELSGSAVLTVRATDLTGRFVESELRVELPAIALPDIVPAGAAVLNRQSGLLEQTVILRNVSRRPVAALDLFVSGLDDGVSVWNATERTVDGGARIRVAGPIAAGDERAVVVEFYSPSRRPPVAVAYSVAIVYEPVGGAGSAPAVTAPAVERFGIRRVIPLRDGRLAIEFEGRLSGAYLVEQSERLRTAAWRPVSGRLVAPASRMLWIEKDAAPGGSQPAAGTGTGARFFRIRKAEDGD